MSSDNYLVPDPEELKEIAHKCPEEGLVVVAAYDGIGGARRALELLDIKPALYISIETDKGCAEVVHRAWPDTVPLHKVEEVKVSTLQEIFRKYPKLDTGLVIGGSPCQPFSALNPDRKGWDDERAGGVDDFVTLVHNCRAAGKHIKWSQMLENVASMHPDDRKGITLKMRKAYAVKLYKFDAGEIGPQSRPRLFWCSWEAKPSPELTFTSRGDFVLIRNPDTEVIPAGELLGPGVFKTGPGKFPTAVRWNPSPGRVPRKPAGIEQCDEETLEKWEKAEYAMAPYQFKKELGVTTLEGEHRPTNADEKEALHGYKRGHTAGYPEGQRLSFLGNTFHCVVVAKLLASWGVHSGYLRGVPHSHWLWQAAGYGRTWESRDDRVSYVQYLFNQSESESPALISFREPKSRLGAADCGRIRSPAGEGPQPELMPMRPQLSRMPPGIRDSVLGEDGRVSEVIANLSSLPPANPIWIQGSTSFVWVRR